MRNLGHQAESSSSAADSGSSSAAASSNSESSSTAERDTEDTASAEQVGQTLMHSHSDDDRFALTPEV